MKRCSLVLVVFLGCQGTQPNPSSEPVVEPAAPPADVVPKPEPEPPAAPLPPPTGERYAASHILIAHVDAHAAADDVTRTRDEARELAAKLHEAALTGEDFGALAREHSDGPSAPRGGSLGTFVTRTMIPEFEAAVASVDVNAIAPLVETPFGFHVIRRDVLKRAKARHVLVEWSGSWRTKSDRSKEEAKVRAEQVRTLLREGRTFREVALEYSDEGIVESTGGELGWVAPGQLIPTFEDVLFALGPGEISDVVETPYGYHVIQRTE